MGNSGAYITYGILMLIMIPIVMGYIGASFGEDISTTSQSGLNAPGASLGFIGDIIDGYSLFPIWLNVMLFLLPAALITRGVLSTSA
jgi:hypothetical protein